MNAIRLSALKHLKFLDFLDLKGLSPAPVPCQVLRGGATWLAISPIAHSSQAPSRPLQCVGGGVEASVSTTGGAGIHSSAGGQIRLDNLFHDGFLHSIATKIHQTELRGFSASNCGAKCSVIGLSDERKENATGNEVDSRPNEQLERTGYKELSALIWSPQTWPGTPASHTNPYSLGSPDGTLNLCLPA